jgi:hypothetical protein
LQNHGASSASTVCLRSHHADVTARILCQAARRSHVNDHASGYKPVAAQAALSLIRVAVTLNCIRPCGQNDVAPCDSAGSSQQLD